MYPSYKMLLLGYVPCPRVLTWLCSSVTSLANSVWSVWGRLENSEDDKSFCTSSLYLTCSGDRCMLGSVFMFKIIMTSVTEVLICVWPLLRKLTQTRLHAVSRVTVCGAPGSACVTPAWRVEYPGSQPSWSTDSCRLPACLTSCTSSENKGNGHF